MCDFDTKVQNQPVKKKIVDENGHNLLNIFRCYNIDHMFGTFQS